MIEEKGPWAAAFGNDKVFVESDDFTHDVRLCVSGDFESVEQKVEYAEEIARRLNTFASRDAEIAELVAALERMRVAGGSQEFHIAWELAKDVLDKVRKP